MNIFQSIILGIVQGLTEFLPVSSTAHLRIVPALLKWEDPGTAYSAVIQLGTVFAVIIFFWKDLKQIYKTKQALWILYGTLPICFFGLLLKQPIENGLFRDLNIIAISLIVIGIVLLISEKLSKQNKLLENITFKDVLLIGFAQSLALIPGVSRSGITLIAAMFIGLKRPDAARFSFLLSIPAVVLSGALELKTLIETVRSGEDIFWMSVALGTLSAFFSGYMAIDFLLKYLKDHKTYVFVFYRVILGLVLIFLSYKGIIQ